MTILEKTLIGLDNFFSKNSIEYVIIGGIAVIYYGYERITKDIDLTVQCSLEDMKNIHEKILSEYLVLPNNSLEFFNKNFVLPIKDKNTQIRIDVSAGLTVFDYEVMKRKQKRYFGEANISICSLEDLIIYKLFAARHLDLADVEKLFMINKDAIDKGYLLSTAKKFIELEREDILETIRKFYDAN